MKIKINNKKYKLRIDRIATLLFIIIISLSTFTKITNEIKNFKTISTITNNVAMEKISYNTIVIEEEEATKELDYRMTYYYTNDNTNSSDTTASGKKTKDFQINSKGWYTYQGKLVVATASARLLSWEKFKNSTQKTYNLYDTLTLTIQGIEYQAIVLDVCGACMLNNKIDLFVSNRESGLDTQIKVKTN